MKNNYINAVIEMIQNGAEIDSVLTGLSKTLEAKGHTRLHTSVLRGVLRILDTDASSVTTQVVVASERDLQKYADAIKTALQKLGTEQTPSTKIDTAIIGGFVAEHNNTIIDTSYKAQLVALYRKLAK